MAAPIVWTDRSLYLVEFDIPEYARFEFESVRTGRDNDYIADMRVRSTVPGLEETLIEAKVNLTSDTAQTRIGKFLASRASGRGELDWLGMFMKACQEVKRSYRDGEPAILLRDAIEPAAADFALPPVVLGRHPTVLFGTGGTAKSLTALAFGLSIHTDRPIIEGLDPTSCQRVLLLDWEFDAWEHKRRMRELVGSQMPDIVYARGESALRDQVDRIKRIVRDQEIGFLIVDSIGPAIGGDPMNPEVALGFFNALRQIGLGALCIAHIAKNGDEETPFGSVFFHNMARSTWLMKRQVDRATDELVIGMFNKKANSARLSRPLGLRYRWQAGQVSVEQTDVRDVEGLRDEVSTRSRLEHALTNGRAASAEELAEELEIKHDTVRKTLRRMERSGSVRTTVAAGPGKPAQWQLAEVTSWSGRYDEDELP
jgi:hypothetical protein